MAHAGCTSYSMTFVSLQRFTQANCQECNRPSTCSQGSKVNNLGPRTQPLAQLSSRMTHSSRATPFHRHMTGKGSKHTLRILRPLVLTNSTRRASRMEVQDCKGKGTQLRASWHR
jgi:hypothetical protein